MESLKKKSKKKKEREKFKSQTGKMLEFILETQGDLWSIFFCCQFGYHAHFP